MCSDAHSITLSVFSNTRGSGIYKHVYIYIYSGFKLSFFFFKILKGGGGVGPSVFDNLVLHRTHVYTPLNTEM